MLPVYCSPRQPYITKETADMGASHNIGVAAHIGSYSDAIEVPRDARWLVTSGTPGLGPDGALPADFAGQANMAGENVMRLLRRADMEGRDIVKATQYLPRRRDLE